MAAPALNIELFEPLFRWLFGKNKARFRNLSFPYEKQWLTGKVFDYFGNGDRGANDRPAAFPPDETRSPARRMTADAPLTGR
jgi:hypothetical protein